MTIARFLVAAAAALGLTTAVASADIIYPDTFSSRPANAQAGVLVEQGRKGILLKMQCFLNDAVTPSANCWPMVNGSPSITINGGAPIACAAGLNPAPGTCGYAVGAFSAGDMNVDTFKILFNGNFPNNAVVTATATGATGNAGSTEPSCPGMPADPGCTLNFNVGANVPRKAASTQIVFDISGSMSQPIAPGSATNRISGVKLAVNTFLEAYKPKTMLGDKIGVAFFSTTASSFPGAPPSFVAGSDPAAVDTVKAQINAQGPTNSTAIGLGLQQADTNGFAADGGSTNAKWVFLFTDGEQNVAPMVSVTTMGPASTLMVGAAPFSTATNGTPDAGKMWVCPITAGTNTAPGFALLQSIANGFCSAQNAYVGGMNQNFVVGDLQTYFTQRLATMLQGDKYEISRDLKSTVTVTPVVKFLANRLDRSFMISLSHAPGAERAGYRLIAPNGTVVPIRPRMYAGGSVLDLELPVVIGKKRLRTQGTWQIVFDPKTFGNASDDYHVIVVNDNQTLSTTFAPAGRDLGTGDPLELVATVLERGAPIPNVKVTVDVDGPDSGIGNVLSKTKVEGNPPKLNGDSPGSPGQQKLLLLYNNRAYASAFGISARPPLSLPRTGGVYSGAYANAALEGHYFFTFHARGATARNGPFERTWKLAVFVRPKPFGPNTPVVVSALGGSVGNGFSATLLVTPHDRIGNFIGPGYDGALAFDNAGKQFPFVVDNLDGSYAFRVTTVPGDSKLVLRTLGQPVKTIDLAGASRGSTL